MSLEGKKIGFGLTGSFCTFSKVVKVMEDLVAEGAELIPYLSYNANDFDTKFGLAADWKDKIEAITGRKPICSIVGAEPVGPQKLLDVMVVAPCSGNTTAKMAYGITDTPVLMAAKAQLRNQRPVVIAVSTNDGLGLNAKNIGLLMCVRNVYFVPFGQDDPVGKKSSLVAKMDLIKDTIDYALKGEQIQPVLIETFRS
ncbi:MAG: dipicolinate synthase subunit B [Fischerella sp.]|nr:dipicolinate synthase subunit B [Fischerella sp.]